MLKTAGLVAMCSHSEVLGTPITPMVKTHPNPRNDGAITAEIESASMVKTHPNHAIYNAEIKTVEMDSYIE